MAAGPFPAVGASPLLCHSACRIVSTEDASLGERINPPLRLDRSEKTIPPRERYPSSIPACLYACQYDRAYPILGSVETQDGRRTVPKTVRTARARAGGLARKEALSQKERSSLASRASRARYKKMSKAERTEAARKAVQARWAKARTTKGSGVAKKPHT
jgi:hypothetical protein